MKKIYFLITMLICAFSLTSCRVNWFNTSYDVPWYFVAVPIIIIFVIAYFVLMSGTYVCPDCKTEFKPKWYQLSVAVHFMDKRLVKCPKCGRKGFCERKK